MRCFLTLLFFLYGVAHFAQSGGGNPYLLEHPSYRIAQIEEGRSSIFIGINKNHEYLTQVWYDFLLGTLENEKYLALYPDEKLLINYWLGHFDTVVYQLKLFDSTYLSKLAHKKLPDRGVLYDNLVYKLRDERAITYKRIFNDTTMSDDTRHYLKLNLDYLLSWGAGKDSLIDSLNQNAENFVRRFPNSEFSKEVKKNIGLEYKNSTHKSASGQIHLGSGIFTGQLQKSFNPVWALETNIDFRWYRAVLLLRNVIGFTCTQDTVRVKNTLWQKNKQLRLIAPAIAVGVLLINHQKFKVNPFVGITGFSITQPVFAKKETKSDRINNPGPQLLFGINLDVYLRREKRTEFNWENPDYHYLRFTYCVYQTHLEKKYRGLIGGMHNFSVAFVLQHQSRYRIK